jgi:hypothetical protein
MSYPYEVAATAICYSEKKWHIVGYGERTTAQGLALPVRPKRESDTELSRTFAAIGRLTGAALFRSCLTLLKKIASKTGRLEECFKWPLTVAFLPQCTTLEIVGFFAFFQLLYM